MNKTIMFLGMLAVGFANAQQNDSYEGRVGINTDAPKVTLNVKSLGNTDKTKNLELDNSDGTKMVTVLDNGNVGINNTAPKDKLHIIGNSILENDNSALSLVGTNKQGINFFPTGLTNPKAQIGFIKTGNSRYSTNNINDFTFKNELGNFYFDNSVVVKGPTTILSGEGTPYGNSTDAIQLDLVHLRSTAPENSPEYLATKSRSGASIFTRQLVLGADSRKGHEIHFGMKNLHAWFAPYISFSTGEVLNNKVTGKLAEHMRIDTSGRVGIGTTEPTTTVHIVPRHLDNRKPIMDPLRIEGLKTADTNTSYNSLVVDANGVVKIGSVVASTGATQLSGTDGIECNKDNRGKMNFKTNDNGSDVFGICMRNKDGNYYWAYMVGGNNPTNGTGTFGSGL